jgi:hypothetical protein
MMPAKRPDLCIQPSFAPSPSASAALVVSGFKPNNFRGFGTHCTLSIGLLGIGFTSSQYRLVCSERLRPQAVKTHQL